MKVVGIIAEYNPMHNGHIYHLRKSKEISGADFVVCAISGNFTQRGEPAFLDKYVRAKLAIKLGADIVVEIPFPFSCNSAEYFALGGIEIIEGLGMVDYLSFGSEEGSLGRLLEIANVLNKEPIWYKQALKKNLDGGESFPSARSKALSNYKEVLKGSNNILAIEYLKALKTLKPITFKRSGQAYRDLQTPVSDKAGAAFLRNMIRSYGDHKKEENLYVELSRFCPSDTVEEIMKEDNNFLWEENYFKLLMGTITRKGKDIRNIFSVGEGFENKILKEFRKCKSLKELIDKTSGKRYPKTRTMRTFTHILTDYCKDMKLKPYTRILGLNEKGGKILKESIKKSNVTIPLISGPIDGERRGFKAEMELEVRSQDIYNLIMNKDLYTESDYVKKPYIGI